MAAAGETSGAPQIETCHKVELSLTIATALHPVACPVLMLEDQQLPKHWTAIDPH